MSKKEEIWCNTDGIDTVVTSKKNKFYIGDPCYALKDEYYDGLWADEGYPNGKLVSKDTGATVMVVDSTAHGDGWYPGFTETGCIGGFGVDAGCLSLIPWEFCNPRSKSIDLGHIITVQPGTAVRMKTYSADAGRGWRGRFVWTFTGTDGMQHRVSISTYR